MKIKNILLTTIFASALLYGCESQNKNYGSITEPNIHSNMPYEDVSADEISALNAAINDEFKARATYQKVIEKFGDVRPFSNIIKAETQHIESLKDLYAKYELQVPEDNWYSKVPEFESIADACKAGVEAEIENAALYDDLFIKVDNQDITQVFQSLRDASEYNHLPAFQRCKNR